MFTDEELKEMLGEAQTKKASAQVNIGDWCWFRNDEFDESDISGDSIPFFVGEVVSLDESAESVDLKIRKDKYNCNESKYNKGNFTLKKSQIMEYSIPSESGLPDMIDMNELNHATLLFNMKQRYLKNEIWTFVGPTLLIINPFKRMNNLFTQEMIEKYFTIVTCDNMLQRKKELDPHIYSVAATAFRQLKENSTKQAIVISGESGAGKTESAKIAMKFLTTLSSLTGHKGEEKKGGDDEISIEQKILNCNPILEAFGNAKTVRNNNSSRFGKYVKLVFNLKKGEILGAETLNYLLEKSRVCKQASAERNYHIFYHLIKGATLENLKELHLDKNGERPSYSDFNYLKEGTDFSDSTILDDKELYDEVVSVFHDLGFDKIEQDSIWRIVAACLKIGQLHFSDKNFDESGTPCNIENQEILQEICNLLGMDSPQEFEAEIVNRLPTPGTDIRTPLKLNECIDAKDSLAKDLYNNMFWWLVKRMNVTILPQFMLDGDTSYAENTKTIGLLDIFGFERFKENFFEQLLINYTNEKLHKLYISAVFDAEKIELSNEGLDHCLDNLKYPDNTGVEVIMLLDEKMKIGSSYSKNGILTMVNDCSNQKPRPTFNQLMDNVVKDHGKNVKFQHNFLKDKKRDKFTIVHSAKEVKYDIKSFIDKNVDTISSSLSGIVTRKSEDHIGWIYSQYVEKLQIDSEDESPKSRGSNLKTIWSKFSVQMRNLMEELAEPLLDIGGEDPAKKKKTTCEPWELHFLRCIKPNEKKISDFFVDSMTLQQVTYMGVLESIEVKQKNYPYRRKFVEFYQRYEDLCSASATKRFEKYVADGADFEALCRTTLEETFHGLANDLFDFGHSKVFCKNELIYVMEKARSKAQEKKTKACNTIAQFFYLHLAKFKHKDKMIKIIRIQRFWRRRGDIIIEARAREFLQKAKDATLKYLRVVHKEKMERDAKEKIVRLFRRNSTRQKLTKFYVCSISYKDIFENAWNEIRINAEKKCSTTVQRILRGHMARKLNKETIQKAYDARLKCMSTKAFRVIQKTFRGVLVRNRLRTLHMAAAYIQGYMRMRWLSTLFQKLRFEVRKIQRVVRRFLIRKKKVQERLVEFFQKEVGLLENVKNVENFAMFGDKNTEDERIRFFKNHTPYNLKKINLFSHIVDIHIKCDTSDVYETPWALHWHQLSKEWLVNDIPIQKIALGGTHTIAINSKNKLYTWGWNESGQLGHNQYEVDTKELKPGTHASKHLSMPDYSDLSNSSYTRIKQIEWGEDHTLIRDENGNVFAFGNNSKGQLGMCNYDDLYMPTRIETLPQNSIKEVATCGDQNLSCTYDGDVYIWPWVKEGKRISIPQSINFGSDKIKISNVTCGYNFGILLSNQGLVFSFGKNNADGQLGHGDTQARGFPEMIQCLKDAGEKVDRVECGFRHCIARTSLGKVYTWGWGQMGQLGHDSTMSELSPRNINLDQKNRKNKAIQIAAGYEHSVILLENRDIVWFGTNGTLTEPQLKPIKLDLSEKVPELFPPHDFTSGIVNSNSDFLVSKINCSWNKSMSLTNIVVADVRSLENTSSHSIQACIKTLSHNWDTKEVEPPYIEAISKYFSVNIMKKISTVPLVKSSLKSKPGSKMKTESPTVKRRNY